MTAKSATAENVSANGLTANWRISTINGILLACYFIPAWTIVAFKIMVSPVHGLFDRPNVAVAIFMNDHLHIAATSTIRYAWLLALGKLTTVAFFAVYMVFVSRPSLRKNGSCNEALWFAIAIGGAISFASMMMASEVREMAALRLHITEMLMMVGAAILLTVDTPAETAPTPVRQGEHSPSYRLSSSSS